MNIRLRRPIRVDGRKIARVSVTAPDDATTLRLSAASDWHAQALGLLQAVTGLPEAAVRQIDIDDALRILDAIRERVIGDA